MYMLRLIILILFFFNLSTLSFSKENNYFLMLKNSKVNVRYGPSLKSPVKYIYKKLFLPVKVIDKKDTFRRIIDHKKNSGWIHISQLRPSKSFIIMEDKIMFQKNSKFSNPKVKLKKGRLVIVKKCVENWCKIKTDEYTGWVSNKNTWGY